MEKELAALKRLQRLDEQLAQLQRRKQHLPQRVAAAHGDIDRCQERRQQSQERLQHHRLEIDRQELELRSREEHIARLRGQLNQVKTNREYQVLLTEIRSLEADVSRLEEGALEAMGEADELVAELESLDGEIEGAQKEVRAVEQAVSEEAEAVDAEIADLESDREQVVALVTPDSLAIYERLQRGLGGRVVVPIVNELCQGCHLPLTPQTISELLSGRSLITCHRCGRILYLEQGAAPEEPEE